MLTPREFLRIHGVLLALLGLGAAIASVTGRALSLGPFAFLGSNHVAAVGFIEAYGLASMIGICLVYGSELGGLIRWHALAAAIHIFLLTINIAFWELYEPLGLTFAGWASTIMHGLLAIAEGTLGILDFRKGHGPRTNKEETPIVS